MSDTIPDAIKIMSEVIAKESRDKVEKTACSGIASSASLDWNTVKDCSLALVLTVAGVT